MASLISDVESSSEMDVDSASQVDYTSLLEESEVSQLERLDMDETRVMLNSMIETCEGRVTLTCSVFCSRID